MTQVFDFMAYIQKTHRPTLQIFAQSCPLLIYSQWIGKANHLKGFQLMSGKCKYANAHNGLL